MEPTLKETQKYLMKKISKYTAKIHYMMVILDIISLIIEQDDIEPFEMDSDSSDDDSFGTVGSKGIKLIDEISDEE